MSTPARPLIDPESIRLTLLNDDAAVRTEFAAHLGAELDQLAAALAPCFAWMEPISEAADQAGTQQAALAVGFGLGVLDDLVIATKLLLAGKLPASGNVMRQATEGVAIAVLCSTDENVVIVQRPKQGDLRGRYWQMVLADDRLVQAQRAIDQLEWNAEALGVNPKGVAGLRRAQKFFHPFSHCGLITIASRAALEQPGRVHIGGHFEEAKLDGYRVHMRQHIGLCSILPAVLDHLLRSMTPTTGEPVVEPSPPAAV